MILAALLLLHGDDHMDLIYFWSSILIVVLPVAVFVTIGYWLARMYWRERKQQ